MIDLITTSPASAHAAAAMSAAMVPLLYAIGHGTAALIRDLLDLFEGERNDQH